MRLFIAIDCNTRQAELKALQQPFSSLRARFVKDFHLTLKFIGEVDVGECSWIKQQLKTIASASFTLNLNGLGTFKSYSQKVIWCAPEEVSGLDQLHKEIESALAAHYPKREAFHPHITLARIKHPHKIKENDKKVIKKGLELQENPFDLEVDKFLLMESRLSPEGPLYKVVETYPLGRIWRDE